MRGKFEAFTPYHYATYEEEDEVRRSERPRVIILGSGPNRIGQGIEFDYCCVHASMSLRDAGYETVMVNCNPETVSTDYDTSDRLYFEPLTDEDVANVLDAELAAGGTVAGVIVSLGGQTPLKLAGSLPPRARARDEPGLHRLGRGSRALERLVPPVVHSAAAGWHRDEHRRGAGRGGADRLSGVVAPSYVLGGRAMEIVYDDDGVRRVMQSMTTGALAREGGVTARRPVLVDRFLEDAVEVDVDAVRDTAGEILIAGVMEHVEEAGVHSGHSACALPPQSLSDEVLAALEGHTRALAESLEVCGLINVQYAVKEGQVYVLEANPRASRTVPFVAKATGVPLAMAAARVMVGPTLAGLRQEGLLPEDAVGHVRVLDHVSVKEAVLPFDRFPGVDTLLGPEMRSTGEVMGVDSTFGLAFAKSQMAAGTRLPDSGTVFLSLADRDKPAGLEVARAFSALGFSIAATLGTAGYLRSEGVPVETLVAKVGEKGVASDAVDLIAQGKVQLVVNTPRGLGPRRGRPAHPYGVGDLQGALSHDVGGGASGPRRAWPTRDRTRSRCVRCRTCIVSRRARRGSGRPDPRGTATLGTSVGAVALDNPVMTASGTSGHGTELSEYGALRDLGALVVKSLSVEPWPGNPAPRVREVDAGMLNSVGLQGPGLAAWVADDLPAWRHRAHGSSSASGAAPCRTTPAPRSSWRRPPPPRRVHASRRWRSTSAAPTWRTARACSPTRPRRRRGS